jgi:hypothetical protein
MPCFRLKKGTGVVELAWDMEVISGVVVEDEDMKGFSFCFSWWTMVLR